MVTSERNGNIEHITFRVDRINALNCEEIKEKIISYLGPQNTNLLLDLKGVTYIDSSGFGCFLSALKVARNCYSIIKICGVSPEVRSVMDNLYLNTIFDIYPDYEAAVYSFRN